MNTEKIMQVISQALENQLRDNKPKETKETLERLMKSGDSEVEAKGKILVVLTEEMIQVFRNKTDFNEVAYVQKLKKLK